MHQEALSIRNFFHSAFIKLCWFSRRIHVVTTEWGSRVLDNHLVSHTTIHNFVPQTKLMLIKLFTVFYSWMNQEDMKCMQSIWREQTMEIVPGISNFELGFSLLIYFPILLMPCRSLVFVKSHIHVFCDGFMDFQHQPMNHAEFPQDKDKLRKYLSFHTHINQLLIIHLNRKNMWNMSIWKKHTFQECV